MSEYKYNQISKGCGPILSGRAGNTAAIADVAGPRAERGEERVGAVVRPPFRDDRWVKIKSLEAAKLMKIKWLVLFSAVSKPIFPINTR